MSSNIPANAFQRGHPLALLPLSRRLLAAARTEEPTSPMRAAVDLRAQLIDLGYTILLMSPCRMMIASPDRPKGFQEYHIDQAIRLLEKCYE